MNSKKGTNRKALIVAPFFLSLLLFLGCKRVDDELLTQAEPFSEYDWFNENAEREFNLSASYSVPPAHVNETQIISGGESGSSSIAACYIGDFTKISSDTIFLLFNGTGGNMDYYYNKAKLLYHSGNNRSVLTIDYHGNGKSEGAFSFSNMKKVAVSALHWLYARGVKDNKLVVYGQGLGAVAAAHAVSINDTETLNSSILILENPASRSNYLYTNALHLSIPQSYASGDEFDNVESLKAFNGHLHVLMSEKDDKFEVSKNGEMLFNEFKSGSKTKTHVNNAKHSNLIPEMGVHGFLQDLNAAINY